MPFSRPARGCALFLIASIASLSAQVVPSSGLIGYWRGENDATDSSVTGNNGTFAGSYVSGFSGSAFNLNGNAVSIPDHPVYAFAGDMSVGLWFNSTATGYSGTIIGQDTGAGSLEKWTVAFEQFTSGIDLHLNGSTVFTISSPNALPIVNAWHHLAVVKSGSNYSFYYDGLLEGTTNTGTAAFTNPSVPLTIGFVEPGYFFSGYVDEVVLYDRALTGAEVAGLAAVPELPMIPVLLGAFALVGVRVLRYRSLVPGTRTVAALTAPGDPTQAAKRAGAA